MISVVQVTDNWHLLFLLPIVSLSCSSFLYKVIFKININLHILDIKGIQAMKFYCKRLCMGQILCRVVGRSENVGGSSNRMSFDGTGLPLPSIAGKIWGRGQSRFPTVLIINVTKNDIFDGSDCTI